jgi:p-aminobenzoyl-glutamate transporter AbgT
MKAEEAQSLIEIVRDASATDIAVVSFVILPVLLAAWSVLLNTLSALDGHSSAKLAILGTLLVVYVIAVWVMKSSEGARAKRIRSAKHIINRLQHRTTRLGSFDYIRRTVDADYSNDFLFAMIDEFPDDFRRATVKGGLPGIALNEPKEDH